MISYHSKISLTSPSSELGCELSSELEYDPPSNEREKISDANNACPFFLILKPNLHISWNVLGALNHHPNHEVRQGTHSNHHNPHHSNCSRPHHHKNHEHHLSSSSLFFFFFIGQMGLGTHTLSSTQESFNFTAETRLQVNITFQVLPGGLKKIDT